MITYQKEPGAVFASDKDVQNLFKKHAEESSEHLDKIPLNPNYKQYFKLETLNRAEVHTIRDAGKLIGYSMWILGRHIHYKQSVTATSTLIYILPEYRKGLNAFTFIKWSIDKIKERKPQRILMSVKPSNDYGKLLERLGAGYFEKIYSIVLE